MEKMIKQYGDIDVKRFYLEFKSKCPKCGDTIDFNNYISHPSLAKPEKAEFYCYECDVEWVENVQLHLSVEVL